MAKKSRKIKKKQAEMFIETREPPWVETHRWVLVKVVEVKLRLWSENELRCGQPVCAAQLGELADKLAAAKAYE